MEKLYYEFKDAYTKALSGTDVNTPWQRRKDAALAIAAQQVWPDAPAALKTYGSFIGGKKPLEEFSVEAKTGMQISLAMAQGVRKYNSTLNGHSNGHVKQEKVTAPKVKRTRNSPPRADSGLTKFFELCTKFSRFPGDEWLAPQIGVKPESLTSYRSQAKKRGYTFKKIEGGWEVDFDRPKSTETITPSDMVALKEIVAKYGFKIV